MNLVWAALVIVVAAALGYVLGHLIIGLAVGLAFVLLALLSRAA